METALVIPDGVHTLAQRYTLPPDQNPYLVYLASLSPGSRRTMSESLETVAAILTSGRETAATLHWGALRFQHTSAIRSQLAERYAPATANKHMAAIRGVLKAAWQLEQMTAEDYHRAIAVGTVRGETLPRGRSIGTSELLKMFEACAATRDRSPLLAARDGALLAVLYALGLRRGEAVALDVGDYTSATGELRIQHAKGNKARTVYIDNGGKHLLDVWLELRNIALPDAGPLFVPVDKVGRLQPRRLTQQSILYIVQRCATVAGIAHISPHDFRRTFVGDLLEAGADASTVQKLAGHSNINTTMRYDRRDDKSKMRAAKLLHVPVV